MDFLTEFRGKTMKQEAQCSCGQLKATVDCEITKTSICHCFECQKRTGSAFGIQTRVERDKVLIEGESTTFKRTGDSGGVATFHFCPKCGSTVFWELDGMPDSIVIAAGSFSNPKLPSPTFMVYGNRMHHWLTMPETAVEYFMT
tara:strand:+ start:88 stop:519 length:432 start_codon:yes stop_codon:yes gene_type:complete